MTGVALLTGAALSEAADTAALTDSQAAFVEQYVQAMQARDFEKYKRVIHPKCLACYTKDNEDFHRDVFQRRQWPADWPANQGFRARVLQTPPPDTSAFLSCPAKATHVIQLDFLGGESNSKTILVNVAFADGSWFEVSGCPASGTLQNFRAARKQKDAELARAETLVSALKDPLRSELKALLKEGKKIEAIEKYRDASGEDLGTAKRVVELLEK